MIVAYQGEPGAFSEEAALATFGNPEVRGYRTFDDLVAAVARGHVTVGLLPCENTITGSIARAYDLLAENPGVRIVGEATHRIGQCLIGVAGASIHDVKRVRSHPVALEQCAGFFRRNPHIAAQPAEDTAGSIRTIVESGDRSCGAIGSALAAERYGASVLQSDIADDSDNFTRFFAISTQALTRPRLGRACLSVGLPHEPGSLHRALGIIADRSLNMRSLVARPNRRRPFEYIFYIEIDAPERIDVEGLAARLGDRCRVLGRY